MSLSPGEQNRLIQQNVELVEPIAAKYRGSKGIPFEDLVSEGMVGLVMAARGWKQKGTFPAYAEEYIRGAITRFIDNWQELTAHESERGRDPEDAYYEWDIWKFAAPYEFWENLVATPLELLNRYEEVSSRVDAIRAAMLSLKKREREIVYSRFMREPQQTLESIARDHEISYSRTVEILDNALKTMRKVVGNIDKKLLAA